VGVSAKKKSNCHQSAVIFSTLYKTLVGIVAKIVTPAKKKIIALTAVLFCAFLKKFGGNFVKKRCDSIRPKAR